MFCSKRLLRYILKCKNIIKAFIERKKLVSKLTLLKFVILNKILKYEGGGGGFLIKNQIKRIMIIT